MSLEQFAKDKTALTILAILCLTFLLRVLFITAIYQPDYSDIKQDGWWGVATNVAAGNGYVKGGAPTAYREPVPVLFFAFLAKVFGQQVVLPILWLVDMGTCWIVYLITTRIYHDKRVALLSMLAFAFYLPEFAFLGRAWTEPFFTFLLAIFIWSFLRALQTLSWRAFLLSGIVLGVCALSRSYLLPFPFLVLPLLLVVFHSQWRLAVRYFFVMLVAFVLVLSPWVIRNVQTFHAFIPGTTTFGWALYRSNFDLEDSDYLVSWHSRAEVESRSSLDVKSLNELERNRAYTKESLRIIEKHPDRYVIKSLYRVAVLWFSLHSGQSYGTTMRNVAYLVTVIAFNSVILILSLVSCTLFRGSWIKTALPLITLVLHTILLYAMVGALTRYSIPIMPYMLMFSAYASVRISESLVSRFSAKEVLSTND